MYKALSFIRLDYFTVKPYLTIKNLLIFAVVALTMTVGNSGAGAAIGMLMAFAALYASYPFAMSEKNGMDVLYATLSIKRNTVVLGRYLFTLMLDIGAGLFAFVFSSITMTLLQREIELTRILLTAAALFLVFSIIQAIQLPLYFKWGYTKAKLLAYLPFIVLPLAIFAGSNLFGNIFLLDWVAEWSAWFMENMTAAVLTGAVAWLAVMILSYGISRSLYRKRDL